MGSDISRNEEISTQKIAFNAAIFARTMLRPPAYPFPVQDITLYNGCRMAYMDTGTGNNTLLFIHGLANYAAGWLKNIEGLSKKYRCVAIDLPGNGLSENMSTYSIGAFSKCIVDFIGRMGLSNVSLVGHSMGGQIALRAVLEAPYAISRLILCAPAGFEQFNELDKLFYQGSMQYMSWVSNDAYNLEQTMYSSFYKFPSGAEKMIKDLLAIMQRQPLAHYREMTDQCVRAMLVEPVFRELNKIAQPALVFFGNNDALIPNRIIHPVSTKDVGFAGVKEMQQATLKMIPDCGHFLQWEKAAVVNEAIIQWLDNAN